MKGLPPSEAMLGRKRFRANSITGSETASNAGDGKTQETEQVPDVQPQQPELTSAPTEPTKPEGEVAPLVVVPPALPRRTTTGSDGAELPQQDLRIAVPVRPSTVPKPTVDNKNLRQEKHAQDSVSVVNDAISRLNALASLETQSSNSAHSDSED